jgi:hypothetical protein
MQPEFSMPYQTGAKMPQNSSSIKSSNEAKSTPSVLPSNIESPSKGQN